ncbi:hypothetical protein BDK51DRAFT_2427, partial [Blyttiomyces helicus]
LWQWFIAVDADDSGSISPVELEQALINGDWSPFSPRTIMLLMSLFDPSKSGKIGFTEFTSLWRYVEQWKGIFKSFDADRSGTIDMKELMHALKAFGLNVNQKTAGLCVGKFTHGECVCAKDGTSITFDGFIASCVTVKKLSDAFIALDTDRDGWVNMSYDLFVDTVI